MTQYAKFISEDSVKYPPRNYKSANLVAFNFDKNIPLLIAEGYKEIVEDERPEVQEGYTLQPTYEEKEDKILVHWEEVEIVEGEE